MAANRSSAASRSIRYTEQTSTFKASVVRSTIVRISSSQLRAVVSSLANSCRNESSRSLRSASGGDAELPPRPEPSGGPSGSSATERPPPGVDPPAVCDSPRGPAERAVRAGRGSRDSLGSLGLAIRSVSRVPPATARRPAGRRRSSSAAPPGADPSMSTLRRDDAPRRHGAPPRSEAADRRSR